jgi:hypothetical protein
VTTASPAGPAGDLWAALCHTRIIRMALEVIWQEADSLDDDGPVTPTPAVRTALVTIAGWLDNAESAELRASQLTRHHLAIRPISLTRPPSTDVLAAITAAIATLDHHGLVITTDDDDWSSSEDRHP